MKVPMWLLKLRVLCFLTGMALLSPAVSGANQEETKQSNKGHQPVGHATAELGQLTTVCTSALMATGIVISNILDQDGTLVVQASRFDPPTSVNEVQTLFLVRPTGISSYRLDSIPPDRRGLIRGNNFNVIVDRFHPINPQRQWFSYRVGNDLPEARDRYHELRSETPTTPIDPHLSAVLHSMIVNSSFSRDARLAGTAPNNTENPQQATRRRESVARLRALVNRSGGIDAFLRRLAVCNEARLWSPLYQNPIPDLSTKIRQALR
jgi:hypothetical protein